MATTMKFGGKPALLSLSTLKLLPEFQGRDEEHLPPEDVVKVNGLTFEKDHLEGITQAVRQRVPLPRIWVMLVKQDGRDPGNTPKEPLQIVVNGFYRTAGHMQAGRANIPAEVKNGTWEEAMLAAAAANKDQTAKRRTNRDKRRQALMALKAAPGKTNGLLAEIVGVSDEFIRQLRAEVQPEAAPEAEAAEPAKRTGKGGKKFKAKKEPGKKRTRGPGKPSDSWKSVALDQFIKIEPEVGEALDTAKVKTAGELKAAMDKGLDLGLTKKVLAHLKNELDGFIESNEPPHVPKVNWEGLEAKHFGPLIRAIDLVAQEYRVMESPEHVEARKRLNNAMVYVFVDWKKQLQLAEARKAQAAATGK